MHRSGANLRSSDYQPSTLLMRHCYLVPNFNFKSIYTDVSSVSGIHAIESVSSAVSPTVTSVHALVFTYGLAGTHVLACVCVSEVVGSSVAGVVAL